MNNEVLINDLVKYDDYKYLYDVLEYGLEKMNVDNSYLEVSLVDNDMIKSINKEYRNIDSVTDVISFAFEDNFKVNSIPRVLGDIYVCVPRMKEQALSYGHSEKRELSFLCIHGLLHLLGYDHMDKDSEEKMFKIQDDILNDLDIRR